MDWVRSLERASRQLDRVLADAKGRDLAPPASKADSGVRTRVRCALVVSEDQCARRLLVEELIAARFFVEWATTAEEARAKASRAAPDVIVVEYTRADTLEGNLIADLAADSAAERAPMVITVYRSGAVPPERVGVTLIQRNNSGQDVADAVRAIVDAYAARR
jgi:hypothetical protein